MSDYANIPIHIRLTDRVLIDPDYTPENYRKHEHLLGLVRAAGRWYTRRTVPESVVAWVAEDSWTRLGPAATALQMEPEDLRSLVRRVK